MHNFYFLQCYSIIIIVIITLDLYRISRDPRAPTSVDSDIRTYTIRDPRTNSSNNTASTIPTPQVPIQVVQPTRPQVQLPPKSASSTDNEKVIKT